MSTRITFLHLDLPLYAGYRTGGCSTDQPTVNLIYRERERVKLGLGLYRTLLTPATLRFARQAGVTHIVAHLPGHFVRGKSKIITSDRSTHGFGTSEADDPIWTYSGLRDLKAMVNSAGLELEALENFAPAHWYDVLLDGPRRAEQMARLKQIVRDVGRAGIRTMGYSFTIAGVWGGRRDRTPEAAPARWGLKIQHKPPFPQGWCGTWCTTPNASTRTSRRKPWPPWTPKRCGGDSKPLSPS